MTKRFRPSEVQLETAVRDVLYEIQQFLAMALPAKGDEAVRNAMLESRLVHTRCLLDFFGNRRSERGGKELDDVIAKDFDFPHRKIPFTQIYKERLNKDLAHLSYSRGERDAESKPWPLDETFHPLVPVIRDFLQHLRAWLNERKISHADKVFGVCLVLLGEGGG